MHFVFTCGVLHAARDQLHDALASSVTSGAFGQLLYDEPLDQVLLSLLGDSCWGTDRVSCWLVCGGVGGAGGCGGIGGGPRA